MKKNLHSWTEFINSSEVIDKLEIIQDYIEVLYENTIVYPEKDKIFRAFEECDFNNCKVVILAMDPYPGLYKGKPSACGVAFATENGYVNPSLRIIFEELKRTGFPIYGNSTYQGKELINWCNQGVLLLNAALTVEQGLSGSHSKVWRSFTEQFIISLSSIRPDIIWLFMGKDAQAFKHNVVSGTVLQTVHPMSDQYSGKKQFVGSDIFLNINNILKESGKLPIIWGNKERFYKDEK